jgi:superkiller protein 3
VKPGNLLLDTRGCVWVTDFGLAKAADQQDLTHTGDVLGTLRYMAPEQFDGRADARSDVYSLGLTLYELLALQPGFDETERHKLVKQVTTGVPARLRTLDRHVPRDLETIVHKALDREPAHRYQTAGELAADLRRYLGDEPIHARRPPLLQRLAKWGRRHRAVIATAGVCLLVGTALLGGTIGWAVRDRAAERAERQAEAERERTARQARVTAQAQLFLADVERLAKEEQWDDALAAANRADAVLAVGEARHAMHENVRQAVKELETVRRLEQIWMERAALRDGDFDHAATVDAYARAFREFGVHVETLPTDAALTRLGAHRRIALPLAAALDQWAEARLNVFGRDDSGARSLVALARRLDPDPLRDRLRLSWCEKVTPELQSELQALAESIDFRREAPQTLNWLAISLAEAGLDELEERVLRQAQQAHPGDVWLNMHLGSFLRERKNYDEAIRFYSAAVGARPTFPAAHTNLGNALRDKGLADEAIAAYREAIRLQPDFAVAHSNLGILLHRKGLTDEAITAYQEAIRHQPDYALAHTNLGIALYYKKGLTDEAIAAFQEAIRDEPDFAVAHRELGSTYFQLSQFDKAISSFRKAVEFDPRDASAHNELSCAYYVLGRYDEAVACCRKAIELDPKFASAHSNLGNVLSKQGKLDDAIACHRKAIELDPHYARPYANLGRDYAKQGNLDEAVDYHRKAIALDPKDASFHSSLGAILSDIKQDYDGAVAAFREAVRLQPEDANAHTNLGNALSKKGLTDEAITACREAIRLQPEHATAHNNLGHALSKQGLTDEAIATYREAIRLQPGYTLAHNNLGHALSKQGLTVEAIAAYTSAIECNPRFASSHNSLAWLLATCPDLKFRNPARAVELGKRAVELSPQEAGVWNTLGVAHYRAGEWQAAIEALEKSMELRTGGDGFDWFFLAMAHWQQGHPDEARQWHDRAVEWMEANQPDDMELRRYRAEAAALLGIADPPPPQEPPI